MSFLDRHILIKTLNERYGNGNWKILSSIKNLEEYLEGFVKRIEMEGRVYTLTSDLTKGQSFCVVVGRGHFVTSDFFLPTYYAVKYGVDCDFKACDYSKLQEKIKWICKYHYPYRNPSITCSDIASLWDPTEVEYFPQKRIAPDLIPKEGRVYELEEVIGLLEKQYVRGWKRNPRIDDGAFYDFLFQRNITAKEVEEYIDQHCPE